MAEPKVLSKLSRLRGKERNQGLRGCLEVGEKRVGVKRDGRARMLEA